MSDKVLSYRGSVGSIETSLEDGCLFGRVLFIDDLVSYEADTVNELKAAFEAAVDNYQEKCANEGLSPDKACSGTFNVRIPGEMHRDACILAAKKGESLNEFVKTCIANALTENKVVYSITQNLASKA